MALVSEVNTPPASVRFRIRLALCLIGLLTLAACSDNGSAPGSGIGDDIGPGADGSADTGGNIPDDAAPIEGDTDGEFGNGDVVLRNHGLTAPITFLNITRTGDLSPDFETNLLDSPVPPRAMRTLVSELCGDPVDWQISSGENLVSSRANQAFPCGGLLDIFVNPDPFVASETDRGILVLVNNATLADNVLFDVDLRRSGGLDADFGPPRLAEGEVLLPGDDTDFDVSPCNIAYDVRLLGSEGSVIRVLENTVIQCNAETEIELFDEDF